MCLCTGRPLIECGTSGYNGQSRIIYNNITECYSCTIKLIPQTFAICTIRSTPSQPVHAVVWAKNFLFAQLFDFNENGSEEGAAQEEGQEDSEEAKKEKADLQKEINELQELKDSVFEKDFAKIVFDKVFGSDIKTLASIDTMWKMRKAPTPLSYDELVEEIKAIPKEEGGGDLKSYAEQSLATDQKNWTIPEAFAVFNDSVLRLQKRVSESAKKLEQKEGQHKDKFEPISFDKDDEDTLDFVVAAAQLRAYIFHIVTKSKFAYKQIAGNIIPAIATTNAIIAGSSVLQTVKLLKALDFSDRLDSKEDAETISNKPKEIKGITKDIVKDVKNMFLSIDKRQTNSMFALETPQAPNPACVVCRITRLMVHTNRSKTTLRDIVEVLVNERLDYSDEVSVLYGGELVYDPDFDDNLDRTLEDLGIKDNSFLTVMDELDDHEHDDGTSEKTYANLELFIIDTGKKDSNSSSSSSSDELSDKFDAKEALRKVPLIKFHEKYVPKEESESDGNDDADDDILEASDSLGLKRKLDSEDPERSFKKIKLDDNDNGIIEIDLDGDDGGDDDGTILVD